MNKKVHTDDRLESLNSLRNEHEEHSKKTLPHRLLLTAIISSENVTRA